MTNLAFLPNAFLKEITATEYKRKITSFYNNHFTLADLDEHQVELPLALNPKEQNHSSDDGVQPRHKVFLEVKSG